MDKRVGLAVSALWTRLGEIAFVVVVPAVTVSVLIRNSPGIGQVPGPVTVSAVCDEMNNAEVTPTVPCGAAVGALYVTGVTVNLAG